MGSPKFSSALSTVKTAVSSINDMMLTAINRANQFTDILSKNGTNLADKYSLNGSSAGSVAPTQSAAAASARAGGGSGGGMSGPQFALSAAAIMANGLPALKDQVSQNYLTNRALFYGIDAGNRGDSRVPGWLPFMKNKREEAYNSVSGIQREFSKAGTTTSPMDASRALMQMQASGMGLALKNTPQLLEGVAAMSNLTPGSGLEANAKAFGALQQGRSVNMLKVAGIQARDPITGQMKSFKDIANQVWDKLQREKIGGAAISKNDIATGLMPGNSLDMMLKNLFGTDELLMSNISAALYARASWNGKGDPYSKKAMEAAGGTTYAVNTMSGRNTKALETLQQSSRAGAGAYALGNNVATVMGSLINAIDRLTGILSGGSYASGLAQTVGGAGNGTVGKLAGLLMSFLPGRASGGPVSGATPYVVGEKGPELFLPKTDGSIVPNNQLGGMFRAGGGGASALGANKGAALTDENLLNVLKAAGFSGKNLDTAFKVARAESGGRATALNPESRTGDYSMGLFQVNMIGGLGDRRNENYLKKYKDIGYTGANSLYDPAINARIAYDISNQGTSWKAWQNTSKKLGITNGSATRSTPDGSGSISSFRDLLSEYAPNLMSTASGGASGGGGVTNNLGGVTINITGAKSPKEVAAEVKAVFENGSLIVKAGKK
ncbi:hypothetical protein UFOVP965_31 [uncultured Caudovirales phage]|uniref:Transglycosylase SLT domain-containing protein n=1 Tax=uncultured Caudovirales phage TaxID=2100421 RepID=A0A6J5QE38_9CAUD|nr:hypothetical protein UFOVP965_31 [uncultured Caudovirales phage]CAB4179741.1 hypothetical protein UFOVP1035_27 [uncultured Caudovirales phage]CAB4188857.1 hypothetical protein UFOVP1181_133 [uncultured Caudovirales phage]